MFRFCFATFAVLVCNHTSLAATTTPAPCNFAEYQFCGDRLNDVTRDNFVTQLFHAADDSSVRVDFSENTRTRLLQKLDSAVSACPSRVTHACESYSGVLMARACQRFRYVLTSNDYTVRDLNMLLDCNGNTGFISKFFNATNTVVNEDNGYWIYNTHRAEEFLQESECKIDKHFTTAVSAEMIGAACWSADGITFRKVVNTLREAYNCGTTAVPTRSTTTQNWWDQTTTQRPWGQTTTDWRGTTSSWNWGSHTTTYSWWPTTTNRWTPRTTGSYPESTPWWMPTTPNWWNPTTTPRPAIDVPSYLLDPFKVTCRLGEFNISEEDPDLVDSLTMVFDGDNTLNCRLILNDLHWWILAKTGETRQKRASDYEPVKIECTRGNLTISSVDPGTSESTGMVFRTGGSKNCITIFHDFLNYIAYAFKSHSGV